MPSAVKSTDRELVTSEGSQDPEESDKIYSHTPHLQLTYHEAPPPPPVIGPGEGLTQDKPIRTSLQGTGY